MRKVYFSFLLIVSLATAWAYGDKAAALQDGDIVFQTSNSRQSNAIQLATHSPYSHMGILFRERGQWFVYEAVQPVKRTPLEEWSARGVKPNYMVKRLKDRDKVLSGEKGRRLRRAAAGFLGRPYDWVFGWSDDRLYCSEYVWKVYRQATGISLGSLRKLGDFDLTSPPVRQLLKERYGTHVPLEEPVISPADIFDCQALENVK